MLDALQSAVLSCKLDGSATCSAGMNLLHYLALQPILLTGKGNMMLKMLRVALKLRPDINAKVCTMSSLTGSPTYESCWSCDALM